MRQGFSLKYQLMLLFFVTLTVTLSITFWISYQSAKEQTLDVGGEMFTSVLKDTVGFIDAMNQQVENGNLSLEEAQEIVRSYVLGPKLMDGTRDISQTKMSTNDYMYVWASHPDGTFTMHPFDVEGVNLYDYEVDGKYTVKDSWSNPNKTGYVFRELWQNEGEPIYTFIAYQDYYEPWDWVIGAGGREEIIYEQRLKGMQLRFLTVAIVTLLISLAVTFIFAQVISKRLNKLNQSFQKASQGDLTSKIPPNYHDEIGQLSLNYNQMLDGQKNLLQEMKNQHNQIVLSSKELGKTSTETVASIDGVGNGVSELAEGAQALASNTQLGAEKLDRLAQGLTEIVNNSESIRSSLKSAEEANDHGKENIAGLTNAVEETLNAAKLMGEQAGMLEAKSTSITAITDVIDTIAAQINLLSLNAAIEAARAGEHGKGFAVVADEVRKLADQATKSVKDIDEIVKEVQKEIKGIKLALERANNSIEKTNDAAMNTKGSFEFISVETTKMANKIQELILAMEEINQDKTGVVSTIQDISAVAEQSAASTQQILASVTQQTLNMEKIANSANKLKEISIRLEDLMNQFKV
ncbi:MAG: methyl-accepting chemotaxis protein [Bacillaceae bacterium]|nr:methyl-accepting chemotaxis protein [Bacillaceae bacterium]